MSIGTFLPRGSGEPAAPHPPLDTTSSVETPERVAFQFRLAGPVRRAGAWLLDAFFRFLVVFVLVFALGASLTFFDSDGVGMGVMLIVAFVMEWGYFVLFELLMEGRSPGKKIMKLRVVREDGTSIRFSDSVLRNLLRAADILPGFYAIGVLVCGFDSRFRRLGDLAAGTVVVVEDHFSLGRNTSAPAAPSLQGLEPFPFPVSVTPDEMAALELFSTRLWSLNPARTDDLASVVAKYFAQRMGMQPPREPARFLHALYYRVLHDDPRVALGAQENNR